MTTDTPKVDIAGSIGERALSLYDAPFRYSNGYIFDAKNNMVADNDAQDVALRVRGWGRISYLHDAEALQDALGELLAKALTEYWQKYKNVAATDFGTSEVIHHHV